MATAAMSISDMTNKQLIDTCVWIEKEQKESKHTLNSYKAELQARGLSVIEDQNTKYVKFYGDSGTAAIAETMKVDILSVDKLKDSIGKGLFKTKIKENVKIDYKIDPKLDKALKAIFTGDYSFEMTLEEFLDMYIKPDAKQRKLLVKKLKGEYEQDKKTLINIMGLADAECIPDFDVELWYIYRIKNGELIKAFLPEDGLDATIAEIRKCIIVETKTSITIDYEDAEGKDNDNE